MKKYIFLFLIAGSFHCTSSKPMNLISDGLQVIPDPLQVDSLAKNFGGNFKQGFLQKKQKYYTVTLARKELLDIIENPKIDSVMLIFASIPKSDSNKHRMVSVIIDTHIPGKPLDGQSNTYYLATRLCPPPYSTCKISVVSQ